MKQVSNTVVALKSPLIVCISNHFFQHSWENAS